MCRISGSNRPIILSSPFVLDTPGSPSAPLVEEVGSDFVHLSWDRPSSDGGGRLTGFILERRQIGANLWTRVNFTPIMATEYNIHNLIEDMSYEFRVIACNMSGEGKPSENSQKILIKDPKGKSR